MDGIIFFLQNLSFIIIICYYFITHEKMCIDNLYICLEYKNIQEYYEWFL